MTEKLKQIPDQNWKRISKTLDFILSHPKKKIESVAPTKEKPQGLLFPETVVFVGKKVRKVLPYP